MSYNIVVALHVFLRFLSWGEGVLEYIIMYYMCNICVLNKSKGTSEFNNILPWFLWNAKKKIQYISHFV